jgi:hypothetical protein
MQKTTLFFIIKNYHLDDCLYFLYKTLENCVMMIEQNYIFPFRGHMAAYVRTVYSNFPVQYMLIKGYGEVALTRYSPALSGSVDLGEMELSLNDLGHRISQKQEVSGDGYGNISSSNRVCQVFRKK